MAFIDELRKIDQEKNNGILSKKEEEIISIIKTMITKYVECKGLNGVYVDVVRINELHIYPNEISLTKLTEYMRKEGLDIYFEFYNLAGTHDALIKLLFPIKDEFAIRFKVKFNQGGSSWNLF